MTVVVLPPVISTGTTFVGEDPVLDGLAGAGMAPNREVIYDLLGKPELAAKTITLTSSYAYSP